MKIIDTPRLHLLADRLWRLPRSMKRCFMMVADLIAMPACLWLAYVLHHGALRPEPSLQIGLYVAATAVIMPTLGRLGLYRAVVRYVGARIVRAISLGMLISVVAFGLIARYGFKHELQIGMLALFALLAFCYLAGSRFAARAFIRQQRKAGERVIIYGAGEAGANLAMALQGGNQFRAVAFVDDSATLRGGVISGIEVFAPNQLSELIDQNDVTKVLLAIPAASRRRRRRIIESLELLPVHVKTMPDLIDIVSGRTSVDELRDVEVADLLGREAVTPHESLLHACIADKVVMVTGAGGSIGSELCRQISQLKPRRLILLDSSELALYNIHKEIELLLVNGLASMELIPLLGFVQNKTRVSQVMSEFKVNTVYHAAAYKHVPMVEQNVMEGIENNVFGTLHSAEAAIQANVDTFVLVSTDKAVCPTNVMGASKRLSEIVLQGLAEQDSKTCFCMVRFGNVLASSGSVVPLFREQIARGGPVTVTHPEIIRYFMTIPEAAQLVIQAGSMGRGGDLFLLDMGKPVRIEDLARRMIHLMGFSVLDDENPDGDIVIEYSGLRPAEKLYEELLIGNNVMGTEHPKILRAEEKRMPWSQISEYLERLNAAFQSANSEEALKVLREAVEEYIPSGQIADLVWVERQRTAQRKKSRIAVIPSRNNLNKRA